MRLLLRIKQRLRIAAEQEIKNYENDGTNSANSASLCSEQVFRVCEVHDGEGAIGPSWTGISTARRPFDCVQGRRCAPLFRERVDSLREPEVELGQAALAVGRENQAHFVVANVDIGMVLFFFGHFRDPIYKIDRISKIIKLKRALDVLFLQLPLGYFLHAPFQLARFDQVSHNRTTSNTRNLFCNAKSSGFFALRRRPVFRRSPRFRQGYSVT